MLTTTMATPHQPYILTLLHCSSEEYCDCSIRVSRCDHSIRVYQSFKQVPGQTIMDCNRGHSHAHYTLY